MRTLHAYIDSTDDILYYARLIQEEHFHEVIVECEPAMTKLVKKLLRHKRLRIKTIKN